MMVMGFYVWYYYLNWCGILYGGVVVLLVDVVFGYCLVELGEGIGGVLVMFIVSLIVDFIVFVEEGDWIEIILEGLCMGSKLVFVQVFFYCGDWLIVCVSVVFVVFGGCI